MNVNEKVCAWLMDNADVPIRYRVARELLQDNASAKKIAPELFEHPAVKLWLDNLTPHNPPQHWSMDHGSFDFNLENALPKLVQLGLHGGLQQITNAVGYYIDKNDFDGIAIAKLFLMADIKNDTAMNYMLDRTNKIYDFTKQGNYDIYISEAEKKKLTGVPQRWKDKDFINPALFKDGYSYPLIYDILGIHRLYELNDPEVDKKIDNIINYISADEFHNKVADGYGILISGKYTSGNTQYHGMGWDPKYPGWFNPADYMANVNAPKLLFFAENIVKYPPALNTKWYSDLQSYLENYRKDNDIYEFPKEWLKESQGYAVQGHHLSFGENRRKKNWREIESTFYMQLL